MKREYAAGINPVAALLERAPERLIQLWIRPGGPRAEALGRQASTLGVPVHAANTRTLDKFADGERHQGIVAEFRAAEPLSEADLEQRIAGAGDAALVLILDQVQDPHNLGACLRSAAAAGACAVVVPRDRSAGLTPAARRTAAGAAEIVPLIEVANLARALERLQTAGVWCVGLAGATGESLYRTDLTGPLALVLGGEEKGLRQLTRKRCDTVATIPMPGGTESLNVSVAAGIALFEAVRQRSA
ncbi:MAG: 23S rRNA (guanosine(2251)-2'-O)-methyltransferase RlmB [Wenzhouxiangellaceae bacterium]|nr:23S rRNA (guanosine(2251)-2'-O)-methyltransferase RlmB [Wenzhouxiangellaceae bacterium]